MARKIKDIFGFEELEKTFNKMNEKYETKVQAIVATQTRQAKKRAKQLTPKKKKIKRTKPQEEIHIRDRWGEKKPKEYQDGKYTVGMIYNTASHAHLYELGHNVISWRVDKSVKTKEHPIREQVMKDAEAAFEKEVEKLLNNITSEVQM